MPLLALGVVALLAFTGLLLPVLYAAGGLLGAAIAGGCVVLLLIGAAALLRLPFILGATLINDRTIATGAPGERKAPALDSPEYLDWANRQGRHATVSESGARWRGRSDWDT